MFRKGVYCKMQWFINIINEERILINCFNVSLVSMSKQFFDKNEVRKIFWKLLFHNCYQVNLKSPSYNLSSDTTHVFSPFVVPGTCPGPWTNWTFAGLSASRSTRSPDKRVSMGLTVKWPKNQPSTVKNEIFLPSTVKRASQNWPSNFFF